jgi:tetratricopeptide (TPR) repeat protein
MGPADCPDDDAIVSFLRRAEDASPRESLIAHFDECEDCRCLLKDLARAASGEGRRDAPDDGEGRYVLLSTLGAGAMGVVQAAFDRQLDRKVALKFLASAPGEDSARAKARLQREAQALAKLAHPNVVTVHDVGVLDDEVYVAMELVEGATLRDWLALRPRALKDVLAVMRQAGEGLAAAHAAGLVHRDFKPENVLVGHDGRVRVTDFGLARSAGLAGDAVPDAGDNLRVATVTQTGVRAGTPAYMAPEQKAGEAPSPRSDIYSFCVTLHEALAGARPGNTAARRVPAWLERIIARGLRARAEDRWPTTRALLDTLDRGPRVTPRRAAVAVGAFVLASAVAVTVRERVVAGRAAALCTGSERAFEGVWDGPQRESVERAFRASGHDAALAYVVRTLDDYRASWVRAEVDTCVATRVRGAQSERLLDLRMACLDDRRRSLGRTVSLLATADASVAGRGVEIVSGVPGIEGCARVSSLEEIAAPGAGTEETVASAKRALDDARALFYAGKVSEARARIDPAVGEVRRIGYAPLLGQLLYWQGNIERDQGLDRDCEATLIAAAVQALEARDDTTLAQIWTLYGFQIWNRPDQARAWVDQAGAAVRRLGGDDELEGERLISLGALSLQRSEAQAALLRARELLVKTRGPDFYLVATCDQRLGNNASDEDRLDEAASYHSRALALRLRLFGMDHEATVSSIFNVAEDAIGRGRPAEAREALRELGTRIGQREPGARAWYALKLGDIARLEGDWRGALEQHRGALALYEAATDPGNPIRASALFGVGRDLMDLRRPKEAMAPLGSAVRLWTLAGSGAPLADGWYELGRASFDAGETARGRELVSKSREACLKNADATDPDVCAAVKDWLASHGG